MTFSFFLQVLLILTHEESSHIFPKEGDLTGSCGKNMNFSYTSANNTLYIYGTGETNDYYYNQVVNWPWTRSSIQTLIIDEGVTSISKNCFYQHSNLEIVSLPNTLEAIYESAFFNCAKLTSIIIPDSVVYMANMVFSKCSSLQSVTLPVNLTSFSLQLFSYCSRLTSINIPSAIENIHTGSFAYCTSLTEFHYPEKSKIDTIFSSTFQGCSKLTLISFNENIRSIKTGAFEDCIGLTTISFPDSLEYIDKTAFFGCIKLESVNIGNNFYRMYENAFQGCSSLKSVIVNTTHEITIDKNSFVDCPKMNYVYVPNNYEGSITDQPFTLRKTIFAVGKCGDKAKWSFNTTGFRLTIYGSGPMKYDKNYKKYNIREIIIENGITTIDENAFSSCLKLTSVKISDSINLIGKSAFSNCQNIKEIKLPETVTQIGENAFSQCTLLELFDLPTKVTKISKNMFYNCMSLKSFYVHNEVTDIEEYAFAHCSNLTTINIPDKVKVISVDSFSYCNNLQLPNLSINNPYLFLYEGLIYQKSDWTIVFAPMNISKNIILHENLTIIENGQFMSRENLESIDIPNHVTSIGSAAFRDCISLKSITIPNNVTSIYSEAFHRCSSLEFIVLPKYLQIISRSLFKGCISLQEITIPESVTKIGDEAFYNTSIKSFIIPNNVTEVGTSIIWASQSITTISFGDGIKSLDDISIDNKYNIENLTIGKGVKTISRYHFSYYTELTYLTFSEGLISINVSAFERCSKLKSLVFPKSLQIIDNSAFSECSGIESLTFNCQNLEINSNAFKFCYGLTSLFIPDNTFKLGSYSFYRCDNLTTITFGQFGNGTIRINSEAFRECINLHTINISQSVNYFESYIFRKCNNIQSIYFSGTKDISHKTPVFDYNFNLSVIVLPNYNESTFLGLNVSILEVFPIESSSIEMNSESDDLSSVPPIQTISPDDNCIPPIENTNSSSDSFELTTTGFNSIEDGNQDVTVNEINRTSSSIKTVTFSKATIKISEKDGLSSSTPLYFVASNEGSTIQIEKNVIKSNIGISTTNSPKVSIVKDTNPISFMNNISDGGIVIIDVPEKDNSDNVIDHLVFNDIDNRQGEFTLIVPQTITNVLFGTLTMYSNSDFAITYNDQLINYYRISKSNDYVTVEVEKLIDLKSNSKSSIMNLHLRGKLSIFDDSLLTLNGQSKFGNESIINLIIQNSKKYSSNETPLIYAQDELNSSPSEIILSSINSNKIDVVDLPIIASDRFGKCEELSSKIKFENGKNGEINSKCDTQNGLTYITITAKEKDNGGSNGKKLGIGPIIGIVIGCIIVVAAIIGVIIYVIKRKKHSDSSANENENDGMTI